VGKSIILIGNGPYLNRGCEAIVRGTLRILGRYFPEADVKNWFFKSTDRDMAYFARPDLPEDIPQLPLPTPYASPVFSCPWLLLQMGRKMNIHRLRYLYYRRFQGAIAKQIEKADVALQIGGDNYSLDYGFPLKYAAIDKALTKKGVPVVIWGASVGPFDASPNDEKWMIRHFQKHIGIILVRESESLSYLQRIGLGDRTFLMADPAFVMESVIPPANLWENKSTKGFIGLNLSPLIARYRSSEDQDGRWIRDAASLIKSLLHGLDRPLLLIPHVTQSISNDYEFMQQALKIADINKDKCLLISPMLTAPELKYIVSGLDLLIAARTHATIAGFSSGVPTISISYSVKSKGLNQQIFNHQDFVIPAKALCAEKLIRTARAVIEQSDDIRCRLSHVIPGIQQAAFEGGEILHQYLNGNRLSARL
jgi:colanic acid/amylovoran biosynthesis protein